MGWSRPSARSHRHRVHASAPPRPAKRSRCEVISLASEAARRGRPMRGAMPGPRLPRSGPLRGNGGPARGRRPAACGTRAASPAGLRGERRGKLGSWNPGNLDRRDCRSPDFQVFRFPGCHCAAATASLPQDENNNEARGSEKARGVAPANLPIEPTHDTQGSTSDRCTECCRPTPATSPPRP